MAIGSIHFGGEWPNNRHKSAEYRFPAGESIRGWHIYSIVWGPKSVSWYIDNNLYVQQDSWHIATAAFPAPFDREFYLILNLAVGGNFDGEPDGNTRFPAEMQMDYVRFYE